MIVITRNSDYTPDGCLTVASIQAALDLARERGETEAFVIGGAEIYAQTLGAADRLYLTQVHAEVDADTFFPELDPEAWIETQGASQPADEKNQYSFTFKWLERKK
jgi:dihydrofolate reductase